MIRFLMLILAVGALIVGGVYLPASNWTRIADPTPIGSKKLKRGDLQITVGATGTIEPEESASMSVRRSSGRIKQLGKDPTR